MYRQRRRYLSVSEPTTGGGVHVGPSCNKILGVNGVISLGSSEALVKGRLFTIASISLNTVMSSKSSRVVLPTVALKARRTDRISRSQLPPICEASGGLKDQLIFRCSKKCRSVLRPVVSVSASPNSRCAPTKLVPLSDTIFSGTPRLLINRRRPSINAFVESVGSTSRCIARMVMHVRIKP